MDGTQVNTGDEELVDQGMGGRGSANEHFRFFPQTLKTLPVGDALWPCPSPSYHPNGSN